MYVLIKRSCMLLLALPFAAMAEPVTVTTHSTGIHQPTDYSLGTDNSVMNILGLNPFTSTAPQPYELTLTSTFDTDTMLRPDDFWASSNGAVMIDFHIGDRVYHYAGPAYSQAHLAAQSAYAEEYSHRISFDTPNYRYGFIHELLGPTGSLGPYNPLAPLDVDESELSNFSAHIYVDLVVNDAPSFGLYPSSTTMSVHVAPVTEPASFALLTAGLAMLVLPRLRRGRL